MNIPLMSFLLLFSPSLPVYFQSEDHGFTVTGLGGRWIRGKFVYMSENKLLY